MFFHNKKRGRSIKDRWLTNNFVFIISIIAIAVIIIAYTSTNYYYSSVQSTVVNRTSSTADFFNKYLNNDYTQFYEGAQSFVNEFEDKDILEIQIIDVYGRVLLSSSGLTAGFIPATGDVNTALSTNALASWIGTDPLSGENVVSATAPIVSSTGTSFGAVRYLTSLEKVQTQITTIVVLSIIISLLFLLALFFSSRYFIRSIIEPISKINTLTSEIAKGRYGLRLQKTHDDEIGQLCDTINYMSDEISRAEKMKNDFISSVSHELRTPLTAIAGWSETLVLGGADDKEEVMFGLDIIQRESRRLTQMVEELLEFARLESGGIRLNFETFDISREVYDSVYMYGSMVRKDGVEIRYIKPEMPYYISGDRYRLKQVFLNVLDNAAKYGGSGKYIDVNFEGSLDGLKISIRDYGPGIKEEELPFVKEKFYKGSSKQRGSGIGLAVTDEIIKLHGGSLTIDSDYGFGTAVTIMLPAMDLNKEISE